MTIFHCSLLLKVFSHVQIQPLLYQVLLFSIRFYCKTNFLLFQRKCLFYMIIFHQKYPLSAHIDPYHKHLFHRSILPEPGFVTQSPIPTIFHSAGFTVLGQLEPFLIGTFDTFLSHKSSPLPIDLE